MKKLFSILILALFFTSCLGSKGRGVIEDDGNGPQCGLVGLPDCDIDNQTSWKRLGGIPDLNGSYVAFAVSTGSTNSGKYYLASYLAWDTTNYSELKYFNSIDGILATKKFDKEKILDLAYDGTTLYAISSVTDNYPYTSPSSPTKARLHKIMYENNKLVIKNTYEFDGILPLSVNLTERYIILNRSGGLSYLKQTEFTSNTPSFVSFSNNLENCPSGYYSNVGTADDLSDNNVVAVCSNDNKFHKFKYEATKYNKTGMSTSVLNVVKVFSGRESFGYITNNGAAGTFSINFNNNASPTIVVSSGATAFFPVNSGFSTFPQYSSYILSNGTFSYGITPSLSTPYTSIIDVKLAKTVTSNFVYLLDGKSGMVRMSYNSNTKKLQMDNSRVVKDISVVDNTVFIAKASDGILVYDISDISNPVFRTRYTPGAQITRVLAKKYESRGTFVYATDAYGFLYVLKVIRSGQNSLSFSVPVVKDKSQLYTTECNNWDPIKDVLIAEENIYLASQCGLVVLDNKNPNSVSVEIMGTNDSDLNTITGGSYYNSHLYFSNAKPTKYLYLEYDVSTPASPLKIERSNNISEALISTKEIKVNENGVFLIGSDDVLYRIVDNAIDGSFSSDGTTINSFNLGSGAIFIAYTIGTAGWVDVRLVDNLSGTLDNLDALPNNYLSRTALYGNLFFTGSTGTDFWQVNISELVKQ